MSKQYGRTGKQSLVEDVVHWKVVLVNFPLYRVHKDHTRLYSRKHPCVWSFIDVCRSIVGRIADVD